MLMRLNSYQNRNLCEGDESKKPEVTPDDADEQPVLAIQFSAYVVFD